jgi:hypothetical protein
LKCDNTISTPEVNKNLRFMLYPPPFTPKGVLHASRILSCAK